MPNDNQSENQEPVTLYGEVYADGRGVPTNEGETSISPPMLFGLTNLFSPNTVSDPTQKCVMPKPEEEKVTIEKPCPPCPKYDDSLDTSRDPSTYNCAGLAHRTYTFIGSIDEVKNKLAVGKKLENCSKLCQVCQVKHWLWELQKWRVEFRDRKGRVCHSIPMPAEDFHTVAGRTDNQGNDPKSIYSKNGYRPLEGPKPPLQWQLKTGDEWTENSPENRPLYFSVTDDEITRFDNYFKQQGEKKGFAKSDLYSGLKQGADLRTSQNSSENLKDVKADSYYLKGVINIEEEKLSCYCLECK